MKSAIRVIISLLFIAPVFSRAQEASLPDYLLHYGIVENLTTGKLKLSDIILLRSEAPMRADFIGKFWRGKALAANHDYLDRIIRQVSDKLDSQKADEKKSMEAELKEDIRMILIAYYYDHAAEISQMIAYNRERAKADPK